MLTKPLAYKGPTDHLSQFFGLPLLYRAAQLLLQELLVDWQDQQLDGQVQGVFLEQGRLIKTQLVWPLANVVKTSICECGQLTQRQAQSEPELESKLELESKIEKKSDSVDVPQQQDLFDLPNISEEVPSENLGCCVHVAALAIASKMHKERLPQPTRQSMAFKSELDYLDNWLVRSNFDPYPAMARHRVIYLLDEGINGFEVSVHKAYLTQQDTYQRKAELEFSVIGKNKLPKFVSLTDQQIIDVIDQLSREQTDVLLSPNSIRLDSPGAYRVLQLMLKSGRCFWQNCHRQALRIFPGRISSGSRLIGGDLYLDKSRRYVFDSSFPLSPEKQQHLCYFMVGRNLKFQQNEMTTSATVNETVNATAHGLSGTQDNLPDPVPCLTVSSERLYFPWQSSDQADRTLDIDIARVSFLIGDIRYDFDELYQAHHHLSDSSLVRLMEIIAARIHQLDWIPAINAHFEQPIGLNFGRADRFLSGDFSHWFVLFYGLVCEGWQVNFDQNFRLNQKTVEFWYSKIKTSSKLESNPWFELEIGVLVDGHSVNVLPYVVEALQRNQLDFKSMEDELTLTLEDGSRLLVAKKRLQAILNNLVELNDEKPLTGARLRLPIAQFSRLKLLQEQLWYSTDWDNAQWLREKAKQLSNGSPFRITVPANVQAILRDYQIDGVNWLQFLRQENLAGILADDMGLGKTLQTLVHIQLERDSNRMHSPAMVVAPTSLLGNWVAEASKFVPDLKLVQWYGGDREKQIDQLAKADLIITSYGVLLRDAQMLNQLDLYMLILDEAQTIKNARSRIARIAYAMSASHRLCLTGTPLENHLGELWSLFHFLMPGFLGDESQFKRLFRIPIERDNDFQRQQILSQRVTPFMLRRTKDKVAKDLPVKTEISESIELMEAQADLYESVRLSMMEEVQKALHHSSRGSNQLLIGNALLRLRQICCHPKLLKQKNSEHLANSSAKIAWLRTILPEMIEAKRKVLLFSTFTSMLDIIAQLLLELDIRFLTLTGKSRGRTALVEKFQNSDIPVFLISLKAGGAGLNLTAADTVIHFDPWWNPAAENQASDRAHRIGQDKPVFVYKLITRGTVEERIHKMQEQKQALADRIYDQQSDSQLEKSDWQKLLAPIEPQLSAPSN